MSVRQLRTENPAQVRRELQARYESYRVGTRPMLGIVLDDINPDTMGANPAERKELIAQHAEKWPRKTQPLIRSIIAEYIFEQQCRENHVLNATRLFEGAGVGVVGENPSAVGTYISGHGRNTCMVSIFAPDSEGVLRLGVRNIYRPTLAFMIADVAGGGVALDPDFGFGNVSVTPEIFDGSGSPELAESAMSQYTAYLSARDGRPQDVNVAGGLL